MSKINKITILVTITLLTFCIVSFKFFNDSVVVEEVPIISTVSEKVFLEINNEKYESNISDIDTVYDFMTSLRQEGKIDFKEKNYIALGKFIYEINGKRGNGDENWIYYVNGKKANVGISNYKLNGGYVVSWKYENDIGF